jgi:hypothetical protein
MSKVFNSMRGTMAANTPKEPGSAMRSSGKQYTFKPDEMRQNSHEGGHEGSTLNPLQ